MAIASVLMLACAAGAAQAATLSGTVYYGRDSHEIPQSGATVTAVDAASGRTVATATSDAFGGYTLAVADGSYDVTFSYPLWTYAQTFRALDLSRSRELDVTLVQEGWARVSATVSDPDGPLSGVAVALGGFTTETGADGRFVLYVWLGAYDLQLDGDGWSLQSDRFTLDGDRDLSLELPERTSLTLHVRGSDETPLAGAGVSFPSLSVQTPLAGGSLSGRLESDPLLASVDVDGDAIFPVFVGSASAGLSGLVTPRSPRYRETQFSISPVHRNASVYVTPQYHVRLTGTLREGDQPLADARIGGRLRLDDYTTADGSFEVYVPQGETVLTMDSGNDDPDAWTLSEVPFDFETDQTVALTLPAREPATIRVVDPAGRPVAGATVITPGRSGPFELGGAGTGWMSQNGTSAATDASGEATFRIFPGLAPDASPFATLVPPEGSGLANQEFELVTGVTTIVLDATPPEQVTLSGHLVPGGEAVEGATLTLGDETATTGRDGAFSFTVAPGTYTFSGSWTGPEGSDAYFENSALELREDRDLSLRWAGWQERTVEVRALVADRLGDTVPGIPVRLPAFVVTPSNPASPARTALRIRPPQLTTGADGTAVFRLPGGGVTALGGIGRLEPPSGSGYSTSSFVAPSVDAWSDPLVVPALQSDTEPPVVACDAAPSGWHTADVAIACTANDDGSGLLRPDDGAFTLSTNVPAGSENANAYTDAREICDTAGNCVAVGPLGPIAVDRAAPAITFELTPDPLVRGDWWTVSRVAVHVTVTDANIGTLACDVDGVAKTFARTRTATQISGTFYASLEGRHTAGCTAIDAGGHVASAQRQIDIDLKNPAAPTGSADRAPESVTGNWFADTVTVTFADNGDPLLADGSAGSGVDPDSVPAAVTYDTSGSHVASGTVTDRAGRTSTTGRLTVKVDADPPTSTLICPTNPVILGARATARWQDADGQSGLTAGASGTVALDSSAIGSYGARHAAVDRVGHTATSTCGYSVVYAFAWRGGVQTAPALNAVAPGVRTQTIWFSIGGDQGPDLVTSGWPQVEPIDCTTGVAGGAASPASLAGTLAWDAVNGRYGIPWDVATDLPASSCVELRILLSDGVERKALFAR
ncbi:carboxypeptidase-like regulatory domain-containing protein [Conexibacter sp. CPCC 206217]|uniref:carboxypeptidase-like regulatory domain-containing protein n=1 Tax=Conexibacter sp. CPCC 206217 TaxID=3064574 RepID=UPI00272936AC|nr:carboxypeptidase regulatory-like domain-containing protein [Conexibacter sp. CPCC 206217]MDO8210157.1 carboxypeptidase regulatory-like domain-containing protein [Conexibacter sp. CPCC 206217]